MAWQDKVSDTGLQNTAASNVATSVAADGTATVTRLTFEGFLDGTETVEECFQWLFDQLIDTDKGAHIELSDFDLGDSGTSLIGKQIVNPD